MMSITNAYVMAGGQSRRMGKDKLFLPVSGEPLLERTLNACRGLFDNVYIVAKDVAKFRQLPCKVLLDAADAEGPMAGIITALRHCPEPACFITAADLRDLDRAVISTLMRAYTSEQYLGIREHGHCQPLCGIYAASSLPVLLKAASRGEYALHTVLEGLNSRFVELNLKVWRDVNRPIDLLDKCEKGRYV